MTTLWMVRCEGGSFFEQFRDRRVVAHGWHELADATKGMERDVVIAMLHERRLDQKKASIVIGASQAWRFLNEMAVGDDVVTYDRSTRRYLVGRIKSEARVDEYMSALEMPVVRDVEWRGEVERDHLSIGAKASLGSSLTLFKVAETAQDELLNALAGKPATVAEAASVDPCIDADAQVVEQLDDLRVARARVHQGPCHGARLGGDAGARRRDPQGDGLQDSSVEGGE